MKHTLTLGFIILIALILITVPVMAGTDNGNYPNGNDNGNGNGNQPIDIDINNPLNIDVDNTFSPDIDVGNYNNNYNTNNNLNSNFNDNNNVNSNYNTNNNYVDQSQKQSQSNVQSVTLVLPDGNNNIIPSGVSGISSGSSNAASPIKQLDVGESKVYSRLVYPGEVIPFEVFGGDMVSLRAASDVGFYTIGSFYNDIQKVNSIESTPTYDPVCHRLDFGIVVPVDRIDYWTTKSTLKASNAATYVIIDNRAPRNSYTHIEVTIDGTRTPKVVSPKNITEPKPVVSVYPVDEENYGMAITS